MYPVLTEYTKNNFMEQTVYLQIQSLSPNGEGAALNRIPLC